MEQNEIYLIDTWRIFVREWRWFMAVLVVVFACVLAFAHNVKRQWEATAWMQVGQVGQVLSSQDMKVEPFQRVIERMQTVWFQNDVLKSIGFLPQTPEAGLYRASFKLDPSPYAGLIRFSVRGNSRQQASQFATATVDHLQAIHQRLEVPLLQLAHAHLDQVENDLQTAMADRQRLLQAQAPGNDHDTGKNLQSSLVANMLLVSKNEEIRGLQQQKNEISARLGSNYTYETSMLWPVYVPVRQAFPNVVLMCGVGLLLGVLFGALAAMARSAMRRTASM